MNCSINITFLVLLCLGMLIEIWEDILLIQLIRGGGEELISVQIYNFAIICVSYL